jgi:hypothetical protein
MKTLRVLFLLTISFLGSANVYGQGQPPPAGPGGGESPSHTQVISDRGRRMFVSWLPSAAVTILVISGLIMAAKRRQSLYRAPQD